MLIITIFFTFLSWCTITLSDERVVLYAPWRDTMYDTVTKDFQKNTHAEACPFCQQYAAHRDDYYLILFRGTHHFIAMNAYPYSKGHLLIIPYTHVAYLKDLTAAAHLEMMELIVKAMTILQTTLDPEGFNVGFNFGRIAGASVPHHLHIHMVPRYPGTPSFLDIIGNTRLVTFDIHHLYEQLVPAFQSLRSE